jgi:hypothetical protein
MSANVDQEVLSIISRCKMQTMLEAFRRWCLIAGLLLSVLLATWTDFRPYYAVSPLSKWDKLGLPTGSATGSSPEADQLSQQRSNMPTPVVTVDPERWQQWFTYITNTFEQGSPPAQWLYRLTSDDVRAVRLQQQGKSVFKPDIRPIVFAENEEPIASLFPDRKPDRSVIVSMVVDGKHYAANIAHPLIVVCTNSLNSTNDFSNFLCNWLLAVEFAVEIP